MEKKSKKNFLDIFKSSIFAPISSMDENVGALKETKTAFIFAGLVSIGIMLANLVATIFNTVFARKYDFWTQKYKWDISLSNLDGLNYVDLIFKSLLQYALMVLCIAGVLYLIVLVLKKETTYVKALGTISVSIIPNIVLALVASILGIIWSPLKVVVLAAAVTYTILILTFALKNLIKENNVDKLVFYSVIVMAILKLLDYIIFTSDLFNII